jgi:hypothetical protein
MWRQLLSQGLTDAIGFFVGALLGAGAAHLLNWNIFAPGYGPASLGGIALIAIGGGAGVQLARRWRALQSTPPPPAKGKQ